MDNQPDQPEEEKPSIVRIIGEDGKVIFSIPVVLLPLEEEKEESEKDDDWKNNYQTLESFLSDGPRIKVGRRKKSDKKEKEEERKNEQEK